MFGDQVRIPDRMISCKWWVLFLTLLIWRPCRGQDEPPNVIFILSDDVGYGDLACYGHPYAETPHLDRLAAEGTMFTQFNVNGNVCPHTRAGLMTGRSPSWFPNYTAKYGFMGAMTITNLLQQAGYVTGHIGKWNIGDDPDNESIEYGIDDLRRTGDITDDPRGREGLRFDDAIDFVEQNQNETFYLNLWIHAVHTPVSAPQDMIDRYRDLSVNRTDFAYWMQDRFDEVESFGGDIQESMHLYLADLYSLDLNVGRLLDTLDRLGLTNDTVVVFASDNGPARPRDSVANVGYAGGLREGKHFYYEGGVRVPFLVRWPGSTPAGEINNSLMFGLDWLPTVCSLAGCEIPWTLVEGEDMSDVFYGAMRNRQTPMLWRGIGPRPQQYHSRRWIRYGPWKLVEHNEELYNLNDDPEERNNMYNDEAEIVKALTHTLHAWNATLPSDHARPPMDPLPFDPMKAVVRLPLPDVSLNDPSLQPTVSPSPLSTVAPTSSVDPSLQPTVSPSPPPIVAPTSSIDPSLQPTVAPSPQPTVSPTSSVGPSLQPTVAPSPPPTAAPTIWTPLPTEDIPIGPNCKIFQRLPVIAKAHEYCGYSDTTVDNTGGYSNPSVDVEKFTYAREEFANIGHFCRGSGGDTFILDTQQGEYVEYVFRTISRMKIDITTMVSSVRPSNLTLELFEARSSFYASQALQAFTVQRSNFTALAWRALEVPYGTFRLRLTFNDDSFNLCAVDIALSNQ